MERVHSSMAVAGVDVSKRRLDVAVHGLEDATQVENTAFGFGGLIDWLEARRVLRVGLEASGGYERAPREALEAAGFEVVVHQPLEVRLFARLKRRKAKNDRIDARTIAAATAQIEAVKAAQDPRLGELAERLTAYEHVCDQVAQLKSFLEHVTLPDLEATFAVQLCGLKRLKLQMAADIVRRIRGHADLRSRFELLRSLPGIGMIVAATLVVRMPELGAMRRGQAASLLGVAPFDRDSGTHRGKRFISGGRERPRRLVYLAALSAKRCDETFKALADRLLDRGKQPKVIVVAVMRKLVEAANLVLARQQPWIKSTTP